MSAPRTRIMAAYPVTAYALSNALGATTHEVLASLSEGRSGLQACGWGLPFPTSCGEVPGALPPPPDRWARFDSRVGRIALRTLEELSAPLDKAISRWGPARVGVVLGTSTGGILETEKAFDEHRRTGVVPGTFDFERQHSFHGLVDLVKLRFGLTGAGYAVSTACSSSGKVLGVGQRLLAAGLADAVLVGGADSLCQTTLRGFHSLEVLSANPCRPFSALRDGTTIGEGAGFLLLEREGEPRARLLGVGESCDAHHMSHPHPEGLGAEAAMAGALAQAGLTPTDVDHVNAHGTATPLNDAAESKAIARLLGTQVPVVSTKGYTGHLLGAAGATEAVFSVVALEQGWIPGNVGAEPVDPAVTVNVNLCRRDLPLRAVLSNSFAFGGNNVSVLFGAAR